MTFEEVTVYFQKSFPTGRFKGSMTYTGGRSFRIEGLKITEDSSPIGVALVTYEDQETVVVDLTSNIVYRIPR